MTNSKITIPSIISITKKYFALISIILLLPMLTSCLVGTTLETFATIFGKNLVSTAAHNYSPKYGDQVEELLYAMAADTKEAFKRKKKVRREEFALQAGSPDKSQNQGYYDDQENNQQNYNTEQDYENQQYDNQQNDYIDQSSNSQQNDYSNQDNNDQQDYYANQNTEQQSYQQQPMSLDVDILAQRMTEKGETPPTPIEDGEILYSVQGNPKAGDKIKLSFKSSCDCYIYIIGIDATGYVASVFPDPGSNLYNPVRANKSYLVPGGTEWYGLDDYKGVEEIYFIASYNRRLDLERIISKLSSQKRVVPPDYKQVKVAAVIPRTRGIVKIDMGSSTKVQASNGSIHTFKPSTFIANSKNADLSITRWFKHR